MTGSTLTDVEQALEYATDEREHTLEDDSPHPLSEALRWSCRSCGAAVIVVGGHVYGSALEVTCDGPLCNHPRGCHRRAVDGGERCDDDKSSGRWP